MTLKTPRLQLVPYDPGHLLALVAGVRPFEERIGFRAADGLRDFIESGEVSPAWLAALRSAPAADVWVHGFGVVHRADETVIGGAMFKGPPDADGMVEIAYGITPGYQRQGYATEAAAALVAFAFADARVRLVRAHTRPTNDASTRVLLKCGFERIGEVIDPDDGLVWRWESKRPCP